MVQTKKEWLPVKFLSVTIIHHEQMNRRGGDALKTIWNSNSNPNYISLLMSLGLFFFPFRQIPI